MGFITNQYYIIIFLSGLRTEIKLLQIPGRGSRHKMSSQLVQISVCEVENGKLCESMCTHEEDKIHLCEKKMCGMGMVFLVFIFICVLSI